jgi:hypothetical protein
MSAPGLGPGAFLMPKRAGSPFPKDRSMTDDDFLRAFFDLSPPHSGFHHRDHLRLAWLVAGRHGASATGTGVATSSRAAPLAGGYPVLTRRSLARSRRRAWSSGVHAKPKTWAMFSLQPWRKYSQPSTARTPLPAWAAAWARKRRSPR